MKARTRLLASTGLTVAVAAAFGGVTAMRASAVAGYVAALERDLRDGTLRITGLQHDLGLLQSKGRFEVSMQPGCGDDGDGPPLKASIEYEVSQFGMPTAPVRFTASARPTGELAEALQETLAGRPLLSARGSAAPGGSIEATLSMPDLAMRGGRHSLKVDASDGRVSLAGAALRMDWSIGRATLRDADGAHALRGIRVNLDLADVRLGTGHATLDVEHFDLPALQAQGVSLSTEGTLRDDLIDSRIASSVKTLTAGGETVRDVALELAVRGLHARSWETLTKVATESCGFQAMTRAETEQVREAVRTMLARGLSVAVSRLSATADKGGVEGELEFGLEAGGPPDAKTPVAMAQQAFARGRLALTGTLLDDAQRGFVLESGLARPQGASLVASFDYARGRLSLNGEPDASGLGETLRQALAGMDATLSQALSGPIGASPATVRPAPGANTRVRHSVFPAARR